MVNHSNVHTIILAEWTRTPCKLDWGAGKTWASHDIIHDTLAENEKEESAGFLSFIAISQKTSRV